MGREAGKIKARLVGATTRESELLLGSFEVKHMMYRPTMPLLQSQQVCKISFFFCH